MSLPGPIFGRAQGRRNNRSLIGVTTPHTNSTDVFEGNYNPFGASGAYDGKAQIGITTLTQHHSDSMRAKYRPLTSYCDTAGPTGNWSSDERFGGGATGQAKGSVPNVSGLYTRPGTSTRTYPQSSWPPVYHKRSVGDNDTVNEYMAQMSGWYGGGQQGYKDRTGTASWWMFRQIINVCYTFGGYKDGSPWKAVHRTYSHNDQTANLGDNMDYAGSYTSGGCNTTTYFLFSTPTDNAHSTSSTRTSAFHMYSETSKSHNSVFDMYNSRMDLGAVQKEQEFIYLFGGGPGSSNTDKFCLTTECRVSNLSSGGLTTQAGGFFSKDNGYGWDNSNGRKINFYNDTSASFSHQGNHGQQKGIPSKQQQGYAGNEGTYNGGYNYRRWNLSNDTQNGTVGKPRQNMGEENYSLGQDWQYMIGEYNGGGQNNGCHKFYYQTDTGTADPSGLAPTAHAGQSSGHCGWRT